MIGYEELGYMLPPPEKIWPPAGKGIRCGTCQFYAPSEDIEDLGQCGLLSEAKQHVHVQACCNFYHNAADKKNPVLPTFPSSDKVKKALAFPSPVVEGGSKGS